MNQSKEMVKLAQMDEADVDQEADESVFEDEDIVTDFYIRCL